MGGEGSFSNNHAGEEGVHGMTSKDARGVEMNNGGGGMGDGRRT